MIIHHTQSPCLETLASAWVQFAAASGHNYNYLEKTASNLFCLGLRDGFGWMTSDNYNGLIKKIQRGSGAVPDPLTMIRERRAAP